MSMIIPTGAIHAAGINLADVAEKMGSLARRTDSLDSAVRSCYYGAGVGNSVGSVADVMHNVTAQTKNKSTALATAAAIYENTETELVTHAQAVGRNIESGYNYAWASRPDIAAVLNIAPVVVEPSIHITETNPGFFDKVRSGVKDYYGAVKNAAGDLKKEYNKHGRLYDVVEYGKAALKTIKGIGKIAAGVGTIAATVFATVATAGTAAPVAAGSVPLAMLEILNGCNDVATGITDGIYVYADCYEEVGKHNFLKDQLIECGGQLGDMLGNREMGEKIGEGVYVLEDAVTFLDSADKMLKAYGAVNTSITHEVIPTGEFHPIFGEISYWDAINNKIDTGSISGIVRSIVGLKPDSPLNLAHVAGEKTVSAFKKAIKFGKELVELATP